jgi:hypothetical protein
MGFGDIVRQIVSEALARVGNITPRATLSHPLFASSGLDPPPSAVLQGHLLRHVATPSAHEPRHRGGFQICQLGATLALAGGDEVS